MHVDADTHAGRVGQHQHQTQLEEHREREHVVSVDHHHQYGWDKLPQQQQQLTSFLAGTTKAFGSCTPTRRPTW